jgi:hypothetical protein
VIDWGLWGPDGFRGWGGGLNDDAVAGVTESSRGYVIGAITPGEWTVVLGKARIRAYPAGYALTVTLHDSATLTERPRAAFAPVVVRAGPDWYAGDFHVHSRESGDATATFAEISALMRDRGLDFAALSDHNTVAQHPLQAAYQEGIDDLLLIRAAEITTYAGHANGFGIASYVDHRIGFDGRAAAGIVADVRAQGGILSVNHPALALGNACIGCAWDHADTPWADVAAIEIQTGAYDATVGLFTPMAIAMWDDLLDQGYRITAIGGSDDHRAGMDTGATPAAIGSPTTLVYAGELSEAAILAGVTAGRAIVKLRGPDDPDVELTVRAGDQAAGIGDDLEAAAVDVEVRVLGGAGLQAVVVRNGEPADFATIEGDDWTQTWRYDVAAGGDRFRLELADGALPVVVTNHTYVTHDGTSAGGCCSGSQGLPALPCLLVALGLLRRRAPVIRCF